MQRYGYTPQPRGWQLRIIKIYDGSTHITFDLHRVNIFVIKITCSSEGEMNNDYRSYILDPCGHTVRISLGRGYFPHPPLNNKVRITENLLGGFFK